MVQYSLIFNAFNTTINTYTDLKLTLCSALIHPSATEDESNYIYIDNIPGVINHKETTSCVVQFGPTEYVRNDMTCSEEQRLAFAAGHTFVPRCQSNSEDLYDSCQCDIGDSETLGQCFCADSTGNMEVNKFAYVEDGDDWARVCVQELQCTNTEVVYNGSIQEPLPNHDIIIDPKSKLTTLTFGESIQNIQSVLISIFLCLGIIFLGCLLMNKYHFGNVITNNKDTNDLFDENKMIEKLPIINNDHI